MKKHLKLMAVLSAAGVLTAAAPELGLLTSASVAFAKADGWVEENGSLKFYEDGGYYATDSWKKNGEYWYYLNEDGDISTSMQIDEYYVDGDGKRVTNQWISITNDNYWDSDDDPEVYWHFYGKDGQEAVSKWQKIDGKWFYFDEDGQMMTGKTEIEGVTYYLGDENDGARKTGWFQLENKDEDAEDPLSWYYFDNNGAMVADQADRKIDGAYYTFENGEMQTGWYKTASSEDTADKTASAAGYEYYDEETGARVDGWREIEGISGVSDEGELYWFYFKNGAPYYGKNGVELFSADSQKYGFNTKGEMQTGLCVVNLSEDAIANFYFGNDGVMKTGKQTIYNEDSGENENWYFHTSGSKKGQGYTGISDDTVYEYGLRKEADDDLRLAPVSVNGADYLVNTNGVLQKAASTSKSSEKPELGAGFKDYKDSNGKVFVVNVNGAVQE